MTRRRLTVAQLAAEAGIDVDTVLILLWDAEFLSLNGSRDTIAKRDTNRARRALGLATRRELERASYWKERLGLPDDIALIAMLREAGVATVFTGTRLTAKAIHRLRVEDARRSQRLQPAAAAERVTTAPDLVWECVGHAADVTVPCYETVVAIHMMLVDDFANTSDPMVPAGVRSRQLLASALSRPATAIGTERKYATIEMAAAALLHSLVHEHPFHNGNKRTALVAMLVLLDENGMMLTCDEDELFRLVLQLAKHAVTGGPRSELADREVLEVAKWLKRHVRWVEKGDRALAWRRLRQILAQYGCECTPIAGNRINVTREVTRPRSFLKPVRRAMLKTQVAYAGEGTEVAKNTINMLRRELELDDQHGIDSAAFYDSQQVSPSEFIVQYRKTLRRLAKL